MTAPIIITGAAQRLGFAAAMYFAEQGERVIVSYRSERHQLEQLRAAGVECVHADFSTNQSVSDFVKTIHNKCKSIRALVHNASDWKAEPLEYRENNDEEACDTFDRMMFIHAKVPYLLNRAFAPLLKAYFDEATKASDIIHLSDYIIERGSKKHIAYASSKAALHNLTLSFSSQLAPAVKVNEIAPALLMFNEHDDEAYRKKALKKSLMELTPGEQEGVKAMDFILQSDYMTGRVVHLDGGRHLK